MTLIEFNSKDHPGHTGNLKLLGLRFSVLFFSASCVLFERQKGTFASFWTWISLSAECSWNQPVPELECSKSPFGAEYICYGVSCDTTLWRTDNKFCVLWVPFLPVKRNPSPTLLETSQSVLETEDVIYFYRFPCQTGQVPQVSAFRCSKRQRNHSEAPFMSVAPPLFSYLIFVATYWVILSLFIILQNSVTWPLHRKSWPA